MSFYTPAIIRFGIIAPLVLNGMLCGFVGFAIKRLERQIQSRKATYALHEQKQAAVKSLESEINPLRPTHKDHLAILRSDPARIFSQILDNTLPKYRRIELERSSLVFLQDKGSIGRSVNSPCSRIKTTDKASEQGITRQRNQHCQRQSRQQTAGHRGGKSRMGQGKTAFETQGHQQIQRQKS